jgi:hypothetical protein
MLLAPTIVRDDATLVKLIAFSCELLILCNGRLDRRNPAWLKPTGLEQEHESLRSLERRLEEDLILETDAGFLEAVKSHSYHKR